MYKLKIASGNVAPDIDKNDTIPVLMSSEFVWTIAFKEYVRWFEMRVTRLCLNPDLFSFLFGFLAMNDEEGYILDFTLSILAYPEAALASCAAWYV